jgi:hypothetical protein
VSEFPPLESTFSLTEEGSEKVSDAAKVFSATVEAIGRTAIAQDPVARDNPTARAQILASLIGRLGIMAATEAVMAELHGGLTSEDAKVRFLSFVAGVGFAVSDGLALGEMDPEMEGEVCAVLWKAIQAATESRRAVAAAAREAALSALFGRKAN